METYSTAISFTMLFRTLTRTDFGTVAAGFGRAALPIARKFFWPVAKEIEREVIVQTALELVEVITKKNLENKQ